MLRISGALSEGRNFLSPSWAVRAPSWAAKGALERQVGPFARQVVPFARQIGPFSRQVELQDGFLTSKVGSNSPYSDRQDPQNRAPVQAGA